MNKKLLLGVVVLVVAAGAVSYMYSNSPASEKSSVTSNQPSKSGQNNVANVTAPNPADKTAPGAVPTVQSGLSSDEKAALAAFGPGGNVDSQVALANKVAKEVGSMDITGCNFVPAVLKIKAGEPFVLNNKGSEEAVLTFFVDNKPHAVQAGSTSVVKATLGNGEGGLFGFYCRSGATTHQSAVLVY